MWFSCKRFKVEYLTRGSNISNGSVVVEDVNGVILFGIGVAG